MPLLVACLDCNRPSESRICSDCTRKRNQQSPYQKPEWRRLSKRITTQDGECSVCGSTWRLTAHHRDGEGPRGSRGLDPANIMVLCGHHHSQYEADKRTGKDTELVRLVEA